MKENKVNRRNFLKIGAVGATAGAISIPGRVRGKVTEKLTEYMDDLIAIHDDFPAEIRSDYKPHSSKDNMFIGAPFHPEDIEANRIFSGEDEVEHDDSERRKKICHLSASRLRNRQSELSCIISFAWWG